MADKNMNAKINVDFEESTSRQSLNSGDSLPTLFGKIKKIFSDLKSVCFSGSYNDLSDKPTTATKDTNGLMSAEDKGKLDSADDTYALKSLYGDTTINVGRKAETEVGNYSAAEGYKTTASGLYSHAEGELTTASGEGSHAEGIATKATGRNSHAEGIGSTASGYNSHAGGGDSQASGISSFSHGTGTFAQADNEVAFGRYNVYGGRLFSIGDGTYDARHNAFEITTDGGKLHDKDIATTDLIPTELPANGGNADTLDGKHASDFLGKEYVYPTFAIYGFGADLNNYVTEYHGFIYNCDNSPIAHDYGFLDVSFFDGTGFLPSTPDKGGVVLQKFSRIDNCVFTRMRYANVWSGWKEISTTPIKSTGWITTPTDQYGAIILPNSDTRRYLSITVAGCYAEMFLVDGEYIVHIANGNYEKIINMPITYIAFYIE